MKTISAAILAFSGLTFQCRAAFSDEIQEIECRVVSMSMEIDHERVSLSGSDLDKIYAEKNYPIDIIKECSTTVFTYGNGFFEMKDFPSICFEAVDVPIDFQTIAKKFYPLVYEKFGNKLKFEKKTISANLPEIGKVKMMMSGYYDLAAMTFHSNGEMKTRNPVHVVFMDAVSQCQ